MIWKIEDLLKSAQEVKTYIDGRYVPARPMNLLRRRFKETWLVFTGKADVVLWEKQ